MAAHSYDDLRPHIGHKVVCACYGRQGEDPVNIAIECEDCYEVLVSYDKGETDYGLGKSLVDRVLAQVVDDVGKHDLTAIDELLKCLLKPTLVDGKKYTNRQLFQGYLSEDAISVRRINPPRKGGE